MKNEVLNKENMSVIAMPRRLRNEITKLSGKVKVNGRKLSNWRFIEELVFLYKLNKNAKSKKV